MFLIDMYSVYSLLEKINSFLCSDFVPVSFSWAWHWQRSEDLHQGWGAGFSEEGCWVWHHLQRDYPQEHPRDPQAEQQAVFLPEGPQEGGLWEDSADHGLHGLQSCPVPGTPEGHLGWILCQPLQSPEERLDAIIQQTALVVEGEQ